MPPQAPQKKHLDTTNSDSDEIKKYFRSYFQAIKELDDQLANVSLWPQAPQIEHFDRMNSDDIKKSFLLFSQTIKKLDEQLNDFKNEYLRLGHVKGLLSAIEAVRKMLRRTREIFFHNAAALVSGLKEQAHTECKSKNRGSSSERFHIPSRYFKHPPVFTELPTVLNELAVSFSLLRVRTEELWEFTEQGSGLKGVYSTLKKTLSYRAFCATLYSDQLNTTLIQHYIHQFTYDLQTDFEDGAAALREFTAISIPAIRDEQARTSTALANTLAAATLFSGVTASTLQMSMGLSDQNDTILVVNTLWFTSLILSVGAALNCVLNGVFVHLLDVIKPLISSQSNHGKLPSWIKMWMDGSHNFLLGASILSFSAGLSVFTFSSNQAVYTPYITIASMMLASAGLGAILIWILYKILMAPQEQADTYNGSSGDSIHSESNKISSSPGRIAVCIKNALPWSLLRKLDHPRDDVEEGEKKIDEFDSEESPSQEPNSPDPLMMKIQGGVKSVSIGLKKKHDPDEINSAAALTELILPDEEAVPENIDFECHGTIRDVEYSDDGKWLAITCAKEKSHAESWTIVLDAKTLQSKKDISHPGSVISETLNWSPSGKKLIVQFERRCDVWDLAADMVNIAPQMDVQDVAWFDEDAFLVAGYFEVIKLDLTGRAVGLYNFEDTLIDSIGIGREKNYLILITHVAKSRKELELVDSWRSEKRIVIYDMGKQEKIYQVPVLGHICCVDPVPGTLDILINQMDRKGFQLWSLDPGSKDMLKKRTITPRDNVDPGDYKGFACIGGNHHQFIFNMKKSGNIDIWRRESGMPYRLFSSSILQEEGVYCFSWRRSDDETATFATAGIRSHTLRIWRGKQVPETSDSPNLAMNEESRDPSQRAVDEAVASFSALSVPPGAKEVEEISTENILKVDPPNGPEVGPSTSNS